VPKNNKKQQKTTNLHSQTSKNSTKPANPEKINAYAHEVEEDYRELEALITLKKHYEGLTGKWLTKP
jgi:hypothetical protein